MSKCCGRDGNDFLYDNHHHYDNINNQHDNNHDDNDYHNYHDDDHDHNNDNNGYQLLRRLGVLVDVQWRIADPKLFRLDSC